MTDAAGRRIRAVRWARRARVPAAAVLAALVACSLTACLGPDARVPEGRDAVRTVPLAEAEALTQAVADVVPADLRPDERALFRRRGEAGAVWSASPMNGFDLTGLSWGGGRAALVTDRHVVFAAHGIFPQVGGTLTFYDRDGWPIVREVVAKAVLPRLGGADLDVAVGRLDAPVPGGVAIYALPEVDPVALAAMARARPPVVVTFARGGRDRNGDLGWDAFATVSSLARVTAGGARVVYARQTPLLDDPETEHAALWGDSSSASFLAQDGTLLLFSHYHTNQGAGAGPNYADGRVQALLREAITQLDAQQDAPPRP